IPSTECIMARQLKLGLDLKGGVNLVLRVRTDEALRLETERESERLKEEMKTRTIVVSNIAVVNPTEFHVQGVPLEQDAAFRQAGADLQAGVGRSAGASGGYTFTMRPSVQG